MTNNTISTTHTILTTAMKHLTRVSAAPPPWCPKPKYRRQNRNRPTSNLPALFWILNHERPNLVRRIYANCTIVHMCIINSMFDWGLFRRRLLSTRRKQHLLHHHKETGTIQQFEERKRKKKNTKKPFDYYLRNMPPIV